MENLKPHSKIVRVLFFWSGIIATFAYRIIIVLSGVNPLWLKVAWYVGTIGFVIYFIHRFQISEKRADVIKKYNLNEKVTNLQGVDEKDKEAISYIFQSLEVSSERWIYIFIFITSGLALAAGIYLDFIR